MPVSSVIYDETRRRDDSWPLQYGVNQGKVRPAELVCQKAVDGERVRKDDTVGFAVVEAECRPRVWCLVAFVGILDRVVTASTLFAAATWMS